MNKFKIGEKVRVLSEAGEPFVGMEFIIGGIIPYYGVQQKGAVYQYHADKSISLLRFYEDELELIDGAIS